MSVQITIRNIPDTTRDELAARAEREGKSMESYLRGELERLAKRPSIAQWLERVRDRKASAGARVPAGEILASRDANRR